MIKLKSLIKEDTASWKDITIDDVESLLSSRWVDRDYSSTLRTIQDFYYDDDKSKQQLIVEYFELLNSVAKLVISLTRNIPHVDDKYIKRYLLSQNEFHTSPEEFFPFPVYVSATPGDEDTIGIMIDKNGKVLEIHEGNDESSSETINMVNRMVNPSGKKVRIYGSHDTRLIHDIDEKGYLPKNLYVSPDKNHASGHLDLKGERSMFSGIIDINGVSQESDLDWRTMDKIKIEKFRWI